MKKIKVGLIGFGNSGKTFHAPLLLAHSGYEIKMVSTSRTEEVKALLPDADVVHDANSIFENKSIELIVNCAPNPLHYSLTKLALESGKHVVVEKPFVNESTEGVELISIAKQKNRILSVFQSRRFDSDFLTVKKLIASGRLGVIQQFESHFDRFRPTSRRERWREQPHAGSGMFYDLGAHLIDQALELFGMPDQLFADIQAQKADALIDDYFHLILYYGKMRVILHSSSFSATSPRFQIFGGKATFVKYGLDPQEGQLKQGLSPKDAVFGVEATSLQGTFTDSETLKNEPIPTEKGAYSRFYEELYLAIETGNEPPVRAQSALLTIQLIELALESARLGQVVAVKGRFKLQ